MNAQIYQTVLYVMLALAVVVFIALFFVKAGYGYLRAKGWGPSVNNKFGWVLMEAPVFIAMLAYFITTRSYENIAVTVMISFFLLHYFQRSFIFPLIMKGKSVIPLSVVAMGITFNLINAYMIGGWLFEGGFRTDGTAPVYTVEWLYSPQFIIGAIIFIFGMFVNLQSDYIIRHLRKPGDTKHYIPRGGMFKYVSSANYLGELTEWLGFAVMTWSPAGLLFFLWTFANLGPRANSLYHKYEEEFGEEFTSLKRKRIIPFIW